MKFKSFIVPACITAYKSLIFKDKTMMPYWDVSISRLFWPKLTPQMFIFFNTAPLLWSPLYRDTRGVFYQASCHCADLSETRAGHTLALKYITHALMGSNRGRALKYSSDTNPVNGWPLQRISFWKISPV